MGQIAIAFEQGASYRQYAVEKDDNVSMICYRYGVLDWRAVWQLPVNDPFRGRYPDPDVIDFIDPTVFLYVPLPSGASGRQYSGRAMANALLAQIQEVDGSAAAGGGRPEQLLLDGPDATEVLWNDPEVRMPNIAPGVWKVSSLIRRLNPPATMSASERVVAITNDVLHSVSEVDVPLGVPVTITSRRVFFAECPMCRNLYAITEAKAGEDTAVCPTDGWDLDQIAAAIDWSKNDWIQQPVYAQDVTMRSVYAVWHSNGYRDIAAGSFGTVRVFWDESRFANWMGGDYTISSINGQFRQAVVGRATWGAADPILNSTPPRDWGFHELLQSTIPDNHGVYTHGLPSTENVRLEDAANWWLTLHHAADSYKHYDGYKYPAQEQYLHQTKGPDGSPAADLAYHFLVDETGVVFEARPLLLKGSHVKLFNSYNIGIQMSGEFEEFHRNPLPAYRQWDKDIDSGGPTSTQVASAQRLIQALADRLGTRDLEGHNQRSVQANQGEFTYCPGCYAGPAVAQIQSVL